MTSKDVSHLLFTEATSGDEVYIGLRIIEGCLSVLLTTSHRDAVDVCLDRGQCMQVVEALERAVLLTQSPDDSGIVEQEIASMRYAHNGKEIEVIIKVGVQQSLVRFDVAFEVDGDEDRGDRAWVFLTLDQCTWLIQSLRLAGQEL